MNIYIVGILSLSVAIMCACISWIWQEVPILAIFGLVISSFTYGFILGESE
jgi:hypothetical protein